MTTYDILQHMTVFDSTQQSWYMTPFDDQWQMLKKDRIWKWITLVDRCLQMTDERYWPVHLDLVKISHGEDVIQSTLN